MPQLKPSSKKLIDQNKRILQAAKRSLKIEAEAITYLIKRLDQSFVDVVHTLDNCQGHLVITGIGKSGLIGQKIAATFSSIGLPAVFLHAGEASHGDLGIISKNDIILAISNSGETEEILKLLPAINRFKCTFVAMTGNSKSTLARRAHFVLDIATKEEACYMNLVPTASTTATLAMGDALVLALMEKRGVRPEDFAMNHPGGSLGRKLFTLVEDLMHTGDQIPIISENADINSLLAEMTTKRLGTAIVVNKNQHIKGIITDGDLRRLLETKKEFSQLKAKQIMSKNPRTISSDQLATKALQIMEEFSITSLIVSNDSKKAHGILHLHDILKSGIA